MFSGIKPRWWWAAACVTAAAGGFLLGGCHERSQPIPAEELYFDPHQEQFRRAWDVDREPQFPTSRPPRVVPAPPTE